MKYTFEISICGCNTICKHCYVSGGPAKNIEFTLYNDIVEKLKPVLDALNADISLTLGNEPFNHPEIKNIIDCTKQILPQYFLNNNTEYLPTTGIALVARKDSTQILQSLQSAGCSSIMLTLHGDEQNHNAITGNKKAYKAIAETAKLLSDNNFKLIYNLMLNKHLIEDWDSVLDFLKENYCSKAHLTIPLYLPVERVRNFQEIRATYDECLKLSGRINGFGLNEKLFFNKVNTLNEKYIFENVINNLDIELENRNQPQWAFFNIDQSGEFYYGNVGLHTKCIGNILNMSTEEIINIIENSYANYDYSAYYDMCILSNAKININRVEKSDCNYVFSDKESYLYYQADKLNTPTLLI